LKPKTAMIVRGPTASLGISNRELKLFLIRGVRHQHLLHIVHLKQRIETSRFPAFITTVFTTVLASQTEN